MTIGFFLSSSSSRPWVVEGGEERRERYANRCRDNRLRRRVLPIVK